MGGQEINQGGGQKRKLGGIAPPTPPLGMRLALLDLTPAGPAALTVYTCIYVILILHSQSDTKSFTLF